ncbi:MAG: hypothetical protein AAB420_01355 [Patescibacteria group bacterium]
MKEQLRKLSQDRSASKRIIESRIRAWLADGPDFGEVLEVIQELDRLYPGRFSELKSDMRRLDPYSHF